MDAKDIVTSSLNYDGRRFRTTRKRTTKYVQGNMEERDKWCYDAVKRRRWHCKSVNQVAALVANRDPFSSVESIVKRK